MPSKKEKNRRKKIINELTKNGRKEETEKLPMSINDFDRFYEFLDQELKDKGCDHSLQITKRFISMNGFAKNKILSWLKENGGYCDCEVLANTEDIVEDLKK